MIKQLIFFLAYNRTRQGVSKFSLGKAFCAWFILLVTPAIISVISFKNGRLAFGGLSALLPLLAILFGLLTVLDSKLSRISKILAEVLQSDGASGLGELDAVDWHQKNDSKISILEDESHLAEAIYIFTFSNMVLLIFVSLVSFLAWSPDFSRAMESFASVYAAGSLVMATYSYSFLRRSGG
jgi:hypothetical protein